jgi:hypothetical protein
MIVYKTLKMHGTSGRTGHLKKVEKVEQKGLRKILNTLFGKPTSSTKEEYQYISGTRRVVLEGQKSGGYYENTTFRTSVHDMFEGKLHKGETVFYEIVGYAEKDSLIMPQASNKKISDKAFIQKYGDTTTYTYGCENGEFDVYIYRMNLTGEDGTVVEYPWDLIKTRAQQMNIKHVLELERFVYTDEEDLVNRMNFELEEADPIGQTHVREGYVFRIEGQEGFKAFKHKGISFKILEGILVDSGVVDEEEDQSVIG